MALLEPKGFVIPCLEICGFRGENAQLSLGWSGEGKEPLSVENEAKEQLLLLRKISIIFSLVPPPLWRFAFRSTWNREASIPVSKGPFSGKDFTLLFPVRVEENWAERQRQNMRYFIWRIGSVDTEPDSVACHSLHCLEKVAREQKQWVNGPHARRLMLWQMRPSFSALRKSFGAVSEKIDSMLSSTLLARVWGWAKTKLQK